MKREKLDTTSFKRKEKLYNNFIKYFGDNGIKNYEDAKTFLKAIVYNSNLGHATKCAQEFVQYFDLMRKDAENKYDTCITRRYPGKELLERLRYKLQSKRLKETYANFAKFELEFLDATDISLSKVRAVMDCVEKSSGEEAVQ